LTEVTLREEIPQDRQAIYEITQLAFADREYADGDEQDLVDRLREIGALTLSLVALKEGEVVGQITFSPATAADGSGPWFALGPVSVTPALQGQRIGAQLIEAGLEEITARGARGCILTGNPVYYARFGFELSPEHAAAREPAEYFQVKWLSDARPSGRFSFHPAFYDEG